MNRFLVLEFLKAYPTSNLNRDENGAPKTMQVQGGTRVRVSSQALKRSWRESDAFQAAFPELEQSKRTKAMALNMLLQGKASGSVTRVQLTHAVILATRLQKHASASTDNLLKGAGDVSKWVTTNGDLFWAKNPDAIKLGKATKDILSKTLFFIPNAMIARYTAAFEALIVSECDTPPDELLKKLDDAKSFDALLEPFGVTIPERILASQGAVDVALFGRMFAKETSLNVSGALAVGHAMSVADTVVEMDFFTAVDDFNALLFSEGSGHLSQSMYTSSIMYHSACLNLQDLSENLGSDTEVTLTAVQALVEAALTATPKSYRSRMLSDVLPFYARVSLQPQSYTNADAFLDATPEMSKKDAMLTLRETAMRNEALVGKTHYSYELSTLDVIDGIHSSIPEFTQAITEQCGRILA